MTTKRKKQTKQTNDVGAVAVAQTKRKKQTKQTNDVGAVAVAHEIATQTSVAVDSAANLQEQARQVADVAVSAFRSCKTNEKRYLLICGEACDRYCSLREEIGHRRSTAIEALRGMFSIYADSTPDIGRYILAYHAHRLLVVARGKEDETADLAWGFFGVVFSQVIHRDDSESKYVLLPGFESTAVDLFDECVSTGWTRDDALAHVRELLAECATARRENAEREADDAKSRAEQLASKAQVAVGSAATPEEKENAQRLIRDARKAHRDAQKMRKDVEKLEAAEAKAAAKLQGSGGRNGGEPSEPLAFNGSIKDLAESIRDLVKQVAKQPQRDELLDRLLSLLKPLYSGKQAKAIAAARLVLNRDAASSDAA